VVKLAGIASSSDSTRSRGPAVGGPAVSGPAVGCYVESRTVLTASTPGEEERVSIMRFSTRVKSRNVLSISTLLGERAEVSIETREPAVEVGIRKK
jgi:hypothetical protein